MYKLPELLCPAGSPEALAAAIEGGADAIYFGGTEFNARINAHNFSKEETEAAIKLAHAYGVRVYIAQNTLVYDREMSSYVSAAESALSAGADALIVADLGGAIEIKKHFPTAELHASTQMSGHNIAAAQELACLGFSRMVLARETSFENIKTFTEGSPIESEVFVHGALCVCHSGQCLFSSVVGGRSGNRGECAQPCRLPYGGRYPLSLKDLALAEHIPELISAGVDSLKIEGRMKSPEYVRDVTRIYRRLLDENRAASRDEMAQLASIFSRGGFTDGYFTGKIDKSMLGVRSDGDKKSSRTLEPFRTITRKVPIKMTANISKDSPARLTVACHGVTAEVEGAVPFAAEKAPLDRASVAKNLTKLGGTPFSVSEQDLDIRIDGELMMRLSDLNDLRRRAIELLSEKLTKRDPLKKADALPSVPSAPRTNLRSARFYKPSQITEKAREYFDIIYLPLDAFDGSCNGIVLPAVIFDSDAENVCRMIKAAVNNGARHVLVGNLGHISLVKDLGLSLHADFRLNITNNSTAAQLEAMGFEDFILSPELSLPQIRDIGGSAVATVYGRLPLMTLEKCVGKELAGCNACKNDEVVLVDRTNAAFPVLREHGHRSIVYNSLPTSMSDRQDELKKHKVSSWHFIFSDESPNECDKVIDSFKTQSALAKTVRRIK